MNSDGRRLFGLATTPVPWRNDHPFMVEMERRSRESDRTLSEILFTEHCGRRGIDCAPIPEKKDVKAPDFEIDVGGRNVFCEVKELEDNSVVIDKVPFWHTPTETVVGKRLREKIRTAGKQLKTKTVNRFPGLIILYGRNLFEHYYHLHLSAAMYGTMTVRFDPETRTQEELFGGGRRMTECHGTSISAVVTIIEDYTDPAAATPLALHVYHNKHARVPLEPGELRKLCSRQFRIGQKPSDWWVECTPP